jgi:hypothetical protein
MVERSVFRCVKRSGNKKLIIMDDKTKDYKHFRFSSIMLLLLVTSVGILVLLTLVLIPCTNPHGCDITPPLVLGLICVLLPLPWILLAIYYRNKGFQWVLDKSAGVIIHQRMRPISRELGRFPLDELHEIVCIKERKIFARFQPYRYKFHTAFHLSGKKFIRVWSEKSFSFEFPIYGESFGRYLAQFLDVPFSIRISNGLFNVILGLTGVSVVMTIIFLIINNDLWIIFLRLSIVSGCWYSVGLLSHWFLDKKEDSQTNTS